tara:strand:- start:1504 stop:1761 length:258 start_codon:yes stop_codon:yes gene_type:complete
MKIKNPLGTLYILWKKLMATTDLKVGTLLRVKQQCRNNITIRQNGEFAILALGTGKYITHDVVFPNGTRCIYMPINWEVVSDASA